jgi:hypothetical protein
MKKWKLIMFLVIFTLVLSSVSMTFGQKSGENQVFSQLSFWNHHNTLQDIVKNVPLEWESWWAFYTENRGDDTHETLINPRVTVESSLNLVRFNPDDPKFFTANILSLTSLPIEPLVYTKEEFEEMKKEPFIQEILKNAQEL